MQLCGHLLIDIASLLLCRVNLLRDHLSKKSGMMRFCGTVTSSPYQHVGAGDASSQTAHQKRTVQFAVAIQVQQPEFTFSKRHAFPPWRTRRVQSRRADAFSDPA